MEINFDERHLRDDPAISEFVEITKNSERELSLEGAQLYYDFPVLKDLDDQVVKAKLLLLSPAHGVLLISPVNVASVHKAIEELSAADSDLEHLFSLVYSRLIRNKSLKKTKTELAFPINTLIFAPNLTEQPKTLNIETLITYNSRQVKSQINEFKAANLSAEIYNELLATIEGSKGIIRPKPRSIDNLGPNSKGILANHIESEITNFDRRQKQGAIPVLDGLERIRGLAGSGKTVVLAMKAALTHLRNPEATIVYTFYTKSLYQYIQRLITRFYRQFDDKDPDWSRIKILHGWGGGYAGEGIYFNTCKTYNVVPVTLREAKMMSRDPFDYACQTLLSSTNIKPLYSFTFIDEAQDFPASFIKLCIQLTEKNRVVFAYDDLQTIFQASTPDIKTIIGADKQGNPLIPLTQDVVLYKCYRNPREILLAAHALGFGVYGRFVQMLENKEQWEDIGYKVVKGDFVEGSPTEIERPENNSLVTISLNQKPEEIVQTKIYENFEQELEGAVDGIKGNLEDGLRPDDILVVVVDDRNARDYLQSLSTKLSKLGIQSNNMHEDSYSIRDFYKDGQVTLSTVHKAKGNEAFVVYVLGIDALYSTYPGVKERNVIFTAMTRAKGWVRLSGIGQSAQALKVEIDLALSNFPYLRFRYPSQEQLRIIKRDLQEKDIRKQKAERKLGEILEELTVEEIERFLEQRSVKKEQRTTKKSGRKNKR